MLPYYNEILEEKKSLCCQASELEFKSTSGNRASPHVLLDTGCDRGDLSTVQDEVTPKIICSPVCIFCKFFLSIGLFFIKIYYLELPSHI
jgi:hypothetical protein